MITWPNNPQISSAVRNKLNARIDKFLLADASPNGAENSDEVENFVLDVMAIFTKTFGRPNEGAKQLGIILNGIEWDTDEPRLAHIQKYINRFFAGKASDAYDYLDRALAQRQADDAQVAKGTLRETGSKGGKEKNRRHKEAQENAIAFYKKNHSMFKTKKEAARYCEQHFPPVAMSTYCRVLRKM